MFSRHILVALTCALALASCATSQRTKATAPTVTFEFSDEDEFDVIAERADLYCAEEYGRDADLIDRDADDDNYEVTFACK
ncbi:MAG: hypothetical protein HC869_26880 [Rhodospirillales bacterium]|nr:hypothetical protein [Rhodospirillales bacterium]